jgi:hypothetical protein
MLTDLDREQLALPWPIWFGDLTNVDVTPGSDVGKVVVPFNGLVRIADLRVPGGTASSQLIMEIFRGGGVGVGAAIITTGSLAVATGGAAALTDNLSVKVAKGETLYIVARGADAGDADDFTAVGLVLWTSLQY